MGRTCAVIHGGQAGDGGQPAAVPFPSLLHVGFVSAVKVWEYVQIFPVSIIGALLEDKPGFPRPIVFGFRTGIVLVIRVVPHLGHRHGGGGQPVGAGAGVGFTLVALAAAACVATLFGAAIMCLCFMVVVMIRSLVKSCSITPLIPAGLLEYYGYSY